MNQEIGPEVVVPPYRPEWVPLNGATLRMVGVSFDAVRIVGERGPEIADALSEATGWQPGPIVYQAVGERRMYFLLPPRSARRHRWPSPAEGLSRDDRRYSYIGIPALSGRGTWPLQWRSVPTLRVPFVDPELLHAAVARTFITPVGPPGGG